MTEPARFYFAFPPDASRLRIEAPDDSVAVTAFTRPPDLTRIQRLPEEQQFYGRLDAEDRTWFLLQPSDDELRLARNQTVTVVSQIRPPDRDEQILSGLYQWEDFEPSGFWKGRFLLARRDSETPLRSESVSSTYCELAPNRDHVVTLLADPHADWIEPRLIYSAPTQAPQVVQVWLDQRLWSTVRTRATRGELDLPKLPSPSGSARHSLRIEAEDGMRFLVRNVLSPHLGPASAS